MNILPVTTFLKTLEADLDWREAELASLRVIVVGSRKSSIEQRGLLRASWAILYAHYEGFAKFAATIFLDHVESSGVRRSDLKSSQMCKSLESEISLWRSLPRDQFISEVLNFQTRYLNSPPNFPEVDTKSNLWPDLAVEILSDCGVQLRSLGSHERKLKTLVARRNEIAHGEKNFIAEVSYYLEYESAVLEVLYELCFELDEELARIHAKLIPPPSPAAPSLPPAPVSP